MSRTLKEVVNEAIVKTHTFKTSLMSMGKDTINKDDVLNILKELEISIELIDNICKERNRY